MEFYWENNRLRVGPSNSKERGALLLLTEEYGLRRTCFEPDYIETAIPTLLQIEIRGPLEYTSGCPHCMNTTNHSHWDGTLPAIPGIGCVGVSERDAFIGTKIHALRSVADLIERSRKLPFQAEVWFRATPTAI